MTWYCSWLSQPSAAVAEPVEPCAWLLLAVTLRGKNFPCSIFTLFSKALQHIYNSILLTESWICVISELLARCQKQVCFLARHQKLLHIAKHLPLASYRRDWEQPVSLYSQVLLSALQHVYTKLRERKISDTNLHNEGKFCGGHLQYLEFQLSSEAKAKPDI